MSCNERETDWKAHIYQTKKSENPNKSLSKTVNFRIRIMYCHSSHYNDKMLNLDIRTHKVRG